MPIWLDRCETVLRPPPSPGVTIPIAPPPPPRQEEVKPAPWTL